VNDLEVEGSAMASEARVRLSAGPLEIELAPEVGGGIAAFDWVAGGSREPILRQSPAALAKPLEAASFPLVPFVNRIRGGCFTFRGREVRLKPNLAGDPSPLHGQGWVNPWIVESAEEASAVLSFRHEPGEWPWAYDARQEFTLDSGSLAISLTCRNASDEPMPCGLGQHPYFPCGPETRLDTRVTHAWTVDENVLPVEKVVADDHYDLRERLVCGQDLDNGFGGWNGEALLIDPAWPYDIRLSSLEARFFQLYSPPLGGICVAEPVTHANAALNAPEQEWEELGMRVLEPGETMSLDARLAIEPK